MTYQEIIHFFGSIGKTASELKISKPAVIQWQRNGVPLGRQYQIQTMSKGKLKVQEKSANAA